MVTTLNAPDTIMKAAAEQMEVQVTACQTLLEKTTAMWARMEDVLAIVDTHREI